MYLLDLSPWQPQVTGPPTVVSFDPQLTRKEDIEEKQIDFSTARRQFLHGEGTKNYVAPHLYSAKPFSKSSTGGDAESPVSTWSDEGIGGEFTCARAVMAVLREEDDGKGHFHPEESDSGLDELSVRSQDTAVFSLDNVSDSGASLPPTPQPLTPVSPPTPQPTTPVNGQSAGSAVEEELEYHAEVLVQNAIQNALAAQNGGDWPSSPSCASTSSPLPVSSSPLSPNGAPGLQSPVSSNPSPPSDRQSEVRVVFQEEEQQSPPPPPQPVSPPQRPKDGGPRIKIQSSYARALASSAPTTAAAPGAVAAAASVPRLPAVCRPPSPPSPEKPEYSYFSKYSEAAELRSTAAATKGAEAEVGSGPFRLRSKKQGTLSMIEEEIRAAQQREEELKKQREAQPVVSARSGSAAGVSHGPVRTGMRKTTISPADKMKSNSLPSRLTLTARTAPGA